MKTVATLILLLFLFSCKSDEQIVKEQMMNASFDSSWNARMERDSIKRADLQQEESIQDPGERIQNFLKQHRQVLAQEITDMFLNAGLDAKVSIVGKNKDEMLITYIFFSDVLYKKLHTNQQLAQVIPTFSRVTITDGDDYTKTVKFVNNH